MRAKAKSTNGKPRWKEKRQEKHKSKEYYANSKWQTSPDPSDLPIPRFDSPEEDTKPFLLTPKMVLQHMSSTCLCNPSPSVEESKSGAMPWGCFPFGKMNPDEKESTRDERKEETNPPSLTPPLAEEDPPSQSPHKPG